MNKAILLPTHTPELLQTAVAAAAEALREGELVALPTETVYGLAANALNSGAVQKIFVAKGRPPTNPVIVHVADLEMIPRCAREWPAMAQALAKAFWPGPLTLVLRKSASIPDVVTANGDTVGIRWPSHPVMQAVIRACGLPLAAPSANPSNHLSPTSALHVQRLLGDRIRLIVDGGQSQVGIESTVVDVTGSEARILRPGMIHEKDIRALVPLADATESHSVPESTLARSPGRLPKHYAPRARLVVASWRSEEELNQILKPHLEKTPRFHVIAHRCIPTMLPRDQVTVIPDDVDAYARALYAELHRCDQAQVEFIVVESVQVSPEWQAIADRLRRASAKGELES